MGAATATPPKPKADKPDRPEGAADDVSAEAAEAIAKAEADKDLAAKQAEIATAAHEAAVGSQLTLVAGGEAPTTSEFKLAGRAIELAGEFEKGSQSVLKIGVEWGKVSFIDKHDKETGQVVETIRRHEGRIVAYDVES